jgi:hypothetical protein
LLIPATSIPEQLYFNLPPPPPTATHAREHKPFILSFAIPT